MGGELPPLLEAALEARGAVACECSHLVLAVNAPGAARAPADLQPHRDVETHDRDLETFAARLREDAAMGRTIALADIAYEGGPETALEELLSGLPLHRAPGGSPDEVLASALLHLLESEGS